jgi:hypothetical protein
MLWSTLSVLASIHKDQLDSVTDPGLTQRACPAGHDAP